jgi:hypothetical protein
MSKEQWHSLSEKEKLLWDQFDDKAKSIILGSDTRKSHFDAPKVNFPDHLQKGMQTSMRYLHMTSFKPTFMKQANLKLNLKTLKSTLMLCLIPMIRLTPLTLFW